MTDAYRNAVFLECVTEVSEILILFLYIVFISACSCMEMREDTGDPHMP